jgi:hypothetical protein
MRLREGCVAQVFAVFAAQVADAREAALAHFLVAEVVGRVGVHERRAAFRKRNVDLVSAPGLLAGKKRRLDRDYGQRRRIVRQPNRVVSIARDRFLPRIPPFLLLVFSTAGKVW